MQAMVAAVNAGRWYSLTIHSTELERLRMALGAARVEPGTGKTVESILRQLERHIKNEKVIDDWERDFDE
jgi:hypothetical protein